MSTWGTGVSPSDEFAEIYEEFFEAYTGDADPFDIQKKIWKKYKEEFPKEKDTPILYTVRYALAQCLWECGVKDEALWAEIDEIIHSGKELRFWGELSEQNPKLQRQRQRSLEQFWTKINSEPKRIRKPKKTRKKECQPCIRETCSLTRSRRAGFGLPWSLTSCGIPSFSR